MADPSQSRSLQLRGPEMQSKNVWRRRSSPVVHCSGAAVNRRTSAFPLPSSCCRVSSVSGLSAICFVFNAGRQNRIGMYLMYILTLASKIDLSPLLVKCTLGWCQDLACDDDDDEEMLRRTRIQQCLFVCLFGQTRVLARFTEKFSGWQVEH